MIKNDNNHQNSCNINSLGVKWLANYAIKHIFEYPLSNKLNNLIDLYMI